MKKLQNFADVRFDGTVQNDRQLRESRRRRSDFRETQELELPAGAQQGAAQPAERALALELGQVSGIAL